MSIRIHLLHEPLLFPTIILKSHHAIWNTIISFLPSWVLSKYILNRGSQGHKLRPKHDSGHPNLIHISPHLLVNIPINSSLFVRPVIDNKQWKLRKTTSWLEAHCTVGAILDIYYDLTTICKLSARSDLCSCTF